MSHEPEHPTPRDAASDTPEAAAPSSSAAPADARPASDFELPAPAPAAPTDAASGAAPGGDASAAPDVEGAVVPGSVTRAEGATPADAPVADAEPGDGSHAVVGAADAPVAPDAPAGAPPAEVPGPRDPWAPPVPVAPGYGQPGAPAGHNPWAPPVPPVPQAPQEHVTLTKRPVPVDAPAPGPEQQPRDPWAPPAPDAAAAVPPQPPHATYPGYPGYPGYHPGFPGYPGYPGHPTQPEYPAYPGYPAQPGYPAHPGYPAQPGYAVGPYGGWAPPVARNGAGLTAMIMGIVGAVLAVSCFGAFLGLPLGIAAVVCGIVGLRIARRGEATNRPQALTGLILGIVSIGLSVAMIALVFSGIDDGWFDGSGDDLITSRNGDWAAPLDVDGTALYDDGVHVTLSDVHRDIVLPESQLDGGTAVTFSVELENTGDTTADLGESEVSAYADDFEDESLTDLTAGVGLPDELSPGERATREITVLVPKDDEDGTFQVEVAPGFDYDYTYWHLDVP